MKKLIWPLLAVTLALFIAHYVFNIDLEKLTKGFIDFVTDILDGPE
jgi:hypothetical protein